MAEAVFRNLVIQNGLQDSITVDSCGTGGHFAGAPPHNGTVKILKNHGILCKGIKASQLEKRHLKEFDFLVAMDTENLADIIKLKDDSDTANVRLLSDFVEGDWVSVPDPWLTGDFELTYELISKGCEMLLDHILSNY